MSVELSPHSQLGFARPFDKQLTKALQIHNPHSKPIGFKIKTTAPKQYCVRPNAGRVEAGETVEVAVILQPMKEDPPPNAKCKDKFLVQSAIISVDKEGKPLSEMWAELERGDKSAIHEQKIRCVYLMTSEAIPEDTTLGEQSRIEETTYENAHPSPDPPKFTNGIFLLDKQFSPPSPASPSFHESAESVRPADIKSSVPASPQSRSIPATVVATSSKPTPPTVAELESELAAAKKEIERLKSELAGPNVVGLRKRGGAAAVDGSQTSAAVQQVASAGVPIPVVAVICFSTFLVTYLLF